MTNYLRSALSSGLGYLTSSLLPEMKPASASELLHKTQEVGSALLSIGYGEILIEITKDENGLRIFTANDERAQNPLVIREENHSDWEAKVTKYLKQHFPKVSEVDYGVIKRRFKDETENDIFTKHYYLKRKTPAEENGSWDRLKRLVITYLAFSGDLLSSNVAKVYGATMLAGQVSAMDPITLISPLPNLMATPGVLLAEQIDLFQYYELSDPNNNLDLSIQLYNGAAAPAWLSMGMGDLSLIKNYNLGDSANAICISGNYAYIATSTGMKIVDITNPNSPVTVASWINPNNSHPGAAIFVEGNYAYYGAFTNGKTTSGSIIQIIDISNPSNTVLKSSYYDSYYIWDTVLSKNYLYLAQYDGGNFHYMTIVDVSNSLRPVWKSSVQISFPTLSGSTSLGIFVSGDYVYLDRHLLMDSKDNIYIINITNPSYPAIVSTITCDSTQTPGGMDIQGNHLFVGVGNICVYDITQIVSPTLVSKFSSYSEELLLDGRYLYSSTYGGMAIFDIYDLQSPELVATFSTVNARDSSLRSNTLFGASGTGGLGIIDAAQRKLSGRPASSDRGLLQIDVTAKDDFGNSITETIAIHVGDVIISPIPNQQVYAGSNALFAFAPDTFDYPGANFTYSAKLAGGLPLPSFISFDSWTRSFIFAPRSGDQNTYRIEVTASDGYKDFTAAFDVSVPDRPPVLAQPLSNQTAYTGEFFEYIFTAGSFADLDNDILGYTARLEGSNVLPGWLGFDSALRRFYGTPFGKGVYPIVVTANDGFGGVASAAFTIAVPNSAPVVLNPPGTQLASVGIPFSYTFNTNTFYDVDNDPLTYSTGPLPGFLNFNPATRTFTGTPQILDTGTCQITLQAEDPSGGAVSTTFSLTVLSSSNNNPPVLIKSIPDATEKAGIPFSFSFDSNTFEDPEGGTLTYQATLEGGAPLPAGIYFDSDTRTLSGEIQTPQSFRITIRAVDPYNAFAIDTFTLNIMDNTNYPPIVLNPLPDVVATVDEHFFFRIPDNTFADVNNDKLTVSVNQSGGQPLPKWLQWDPATNSLSGVPGPFDTGTFQDKVIDVEVWASDGNGSVKTPFKIIVQGQSFWETFIKYGVSFTSIAISGIGFFESRARIWNYFMKSKYHRGTVKVLVGEEFQFKLSLESRKIKEISVLYEDKVLPKHKPLPDGLDFKNDQIKGIPTDKSAGRYTVRVYDQNGYINEEFDLIIKKSANDPDPIEKGCISSSLTKKSVDDDNRSIMLQNLLRDDISN